MNEEDLRDCLAIMATAGLTFKHGGFDPAEPWRIADAVLSERKPKEEAGIATVKRTRKPK